MECITIPITQVETGPKPLAKSSIIRKENEVEKAGMNNNH